MNLTLINITPMTKTDTCILKCLSSLIPLCMIVFKYSIIHTYMYMYMVMWQDYWGPVAFNYLKECKSLHVGCVAKHGRLATRNYYLLCNSLLSQIVDCSSSCAPYLRFSTDCVTFLKMYFLPGKLGHMFVDL